MKRNFILFYISFFLTNVFMSGCSDFVRLDSTPTAMNAKVLFSDVKTAHGAVVGIYNDMAGTTRFTGGLMTIYGGLLADELSPTGANDNYLSFYTNNVPINSSIISFNLWSRTYASLYRANAVLEGLESSEALKEEDKIPLMGECLFVRAFVHFYLVNLFGDIPLVTLSDYRINTSLGRAPVSQVYKQIQSDLANAIKFLPAYYISETRGRPNKAAAQALLARVCLYLEDWESAEKYATEVIDNSLYSVDSLKNVFKPDSKETIWRFVNGGNPPDAGVFVPRTATIAPSIALQSELFDLFDSEDLRKKVWIGEQVLSNQVYHYPYKYKDRDLIPVSEHLVVLRLSEQYLIRGEARANLGNIEGSKSDLKVIRERADLSIASSISDENILDLFILERRLELFAEWGHRWFDLKRTNTVDKVMKNRKENWQKDAQLLPIPEEQLLVNIFLTQNPGYEN